MFGLLTEPQTSRLGFENITRLIIYHRTHTYQTQQPLPNSPSPARGCSGNSGLGKIYHVTRNWEVGRSLLCLTWALQTNPFDCAKVGCPHEGFDLELNYGSHAIFTRLGDPKLTCPVHPDTQQNRTLAEIRRLGKSSNLRVPGGGVSGCAHQGSAAEYKGSVLHPVMVRTHS